MAGNSTGTGTVLTIDDLPVLTEKLSSIAYQWYQLGIQLGFHPGDLKGIEVGTAALGVSRSLNELLTKWLHRAKPPSTLQSLIAVVGGAIISNQVLARKLDQECGDFPSIKGQLKPDYDGTLSAQGGSSTMASTSIQQNNDRQLTQDDFMDITEYLLEFNETQIYHLGLVLGLRYATAVEIKRSPTYRDDMIAAWLAKMDDVGKKGGPTWRNLANAMRHKRLTQHGVADKIASDKGFL